MKQITLSEETADLITTDTLNFHKAIVEKEQNDFLKQIENEPLTSAQSFEFSHNAQLIFHFNEVLKYFGVS